MHWRGSLGQVVDGYTGVHSFVSQINDARSALEATWQMVQLACERREFAVEAVPEAIKRSRILPVPGSITSALWLNVNNAQYDLEQARGELDTRERLSRNRRSEEGNWGTASE